MRAVLLLSLAAASVTGMSCAQQSRSADGSKTAGPPDARQLIDIVLKSRDVPRTVDVTCASTGSEAADRTLGDYLATLLTEYTRQEGKNWITAGCQAAPANDTSGAAWHCEVMFHHRYDEDSWDRGLFFRLTRDRSVIRNSYKCTGGG
jgi:hypothetical protein